MPITALSTPPSRNDPASFAERADTFLAQLPTFATEANILQADVNSKQTAAATSAANALASENAANAASNASVWVSGTTYAIGNVRYSPINFKSYRRKTAGAGTTDPSLDSTNWELLTGLGDVDTNSNQTITGVKTFTSTIIGDISGSAGTLDGIDSTGFTRSTGTSELGSLARTSSNVPGAFGGILNLRNSGGGSGAGTAVDAILHNVPVAGISFMDTGDGGAEVQFHYTPPGDANTDRRVFATMRLRNDGVLEARGFLPTAGVGAVGTYAMLFSRSVNLTAGQTVAGSNLRAQGLARSADNVLSTGDSTGPAQSGTWLSLTTQSAGGFGCIGFFLRIS